MFPVQKDSTDPMDLRARTRWAGPPAESSFAASPLSNPSPMEAFLQGSDFQGVSPSSRENLGLMLVQLSDAMGERTAFPLETAASDGSPFTSGDNLSAMASSMLNFIGLMVGAVSGDETTPDLSLDEGSLEGDGPIAPLSSPEACTPVDQTAAPNCVNGPNAPGGSDPVKLPDMEQRNDLAGTVMARRQLARIALSLGLPDHAVWILMSAFGEVRNSLDDVVAQLGDTPPSGQVLTYVESLRNLKDKVLMDLRMALADNGGPELTLDEVEALVARDKDYDGSQGAGATRALKHFNRNTSKTALMKNTGSAMDKVAKSLLMLLTGVAKSLLDLHASARSGNADITRGGAISGVNAPLTRLEQVKALMRIMKAGQNSFKDKLVSCLPMGDIEKLIEQLAMIADQVFLEMLARAAAGNAGQSKSPDNVLKGLDRGICKMNAERNPQSGRGKGLSTPAPFDYGDHSPGGGREMRFGMSVVSADGSEGLSIGGFSLEGFSGGGDLGMSGFSLSGFQIQG